MADEKKKYLRAIMKRTREAAPSELCAALSARVQAILLASAPYRNSAILAVYSPIGNEVATGAIVAHAIGSGRTVYYPRVDTDGERLAMHRVADRSELSPGAFGILEPSRDTPWVVPARMPACVVLVPGVAFSPDGARLGRGGGHYDRLLAEIGPQAITVGLGYSFQLLDRIPEDEWDQRLNFVVTESALYSAALERGEARHQGGNPR